MQDNDTAGVMSLVTHTSKDAYQKLPKSQKDQLLLADILILLSIVCLQNGDFSAAEDFGMKSLEIRRELMMPEDLAMTNCYNYLGIACDSDLRHSEARFWLEKSADILKDHDENLYVRLACQNNLNRARNLYCTGQYEQSKQLLDVSMSQATKFESWYSLA